MPKTVLLDGNNVMMRCLHTDGTLIYDTYDNKKVVDYDWNWFRFSIFKSIYFSLVQAKDAQECVFAIDGDSKSTWRKLYWSRYKENRKKDETVDWELVFDKYFSFMQEIKENFPIKVLRHKNAEGDDIIATIVMNTPQEHFIVSVDKDFQQLYENGRVSIYSPIKQSTIEHPNPEMFIVEQCMIGQAKDNIFNIITPIDHPDGKRKPGFGEKSFEKVFISGWREWLKEKGLEERFEFNRNLIDFKRIPKTLQTAIMEMYKVKNYAEPDKMYEFIKKNNWTFFMEDWTRVEYVLLNLY